MSDERPDPDPNQGVDDIALAAMVRTVMDRHWHPVGFTVPSRATYPHLWLWDSCFHALIWNALGEQERAITELATALGSQADDGFVPHVVYPDEQPHRAFWGRDRTSSITQPPMYGHAVAELARAGAELPGELLDRARRGLEFLFARRQRVDGLVVVAHPWETGADDSPRWDRWWGSPPSPEARYAVKGELMATIDRSPAGSPLGNTALRVAPASFNALVAFNALELAEVLDDTDLVSWASELRDGLDASWDGDLATWVDAGDSSSGSGRVRTADALLPALVTSREAAVDAVAAQLRDPAALWGRFGPAGAHRGESSFDPRAYWRGSSWPQVDYLLWLGARRRGDRALAEELRIATRRGAVRSGLSEHWDPDDGTPLGARPQAWAGLVVTMA